MHKPNTRRRAQSSLRPPQSAVTLTQPRVGGVNGDVVECPLWKAAALDHGYSFSPEWQNPENQVVSGVHHSFSEHRASIKWDR